MRKIRAIMESACSVPTDCLWLNEKELKAFINGAWTTIGREPTEVNWDDIQGKPTFSKVSMSGSYNDLTNKPIIPTAVVNASTSRAGIVKQITNTPNLDTEATLVNVINAINNLYAKMQSAGIMASS